MRLLRAVMVCLVVALTFAPGVAPVLQAAVTHHRVVLYAGPAARPFLADTYTSQPDGTAGVDARIVSSAATTNFGSDAILEAGEYNGAVNDFRRSLIKFDLSSIPSNVTINSATLSLWQYDERSDNNRTLRVYRSKRAWVEAQVTWNIFSTGNNWQTAGGFGANDAEQTDIGSRAFTSTEASGEKQWSLTASAIQEIVSGSFTNNGFLLKADTELNDHYLFRSSDYATAANRPKLVIDYTVPTNTPTNTATSTATDTATSTATDTPSNTPTNTFTPSNTATDTATSTATDTATSTATDTPGPSSTFTFTPTDTATATVTLTPTIALTASATIAGYLFTLASGQTFVVDPEMTFGDIARGAALMALSLLILVYVIYRVIDRWA